MLISTLTVPCLTCGAILNNPDRCARVACLACRGKIIAAPTVEVPFVDVSHETAYGTTVRLSNAVRCF